MTVSEHSLTAIQTRASRPMVVIVGADDAAQMAAVAAMPLADAILIGHQGTIAGDLARRVRRVEDITLIRDDAADSAAALQTELESAAVGRAFLMALQERRGHLILLDLDRPTGLYRTTNTHAASSSPSNQVSAFLEPAETLLRLLSARSQPLRLDTLNRECPISLALGCGVLEPQHLRRDAGVSVVLVPLIPRDCDAAVANFALWSDVQYYPRDSRGPSTTDLVFVFNCAHDQELETRLREAFAEFAEVNQCFRAMRVAFLGLEGEDDRYIRRATGPMPRYGYKAGPNLLFFGALARLRQWGYPGFAALLEVDCRPLRRGWLDGLDRLARRHAEAWVIGSIYRGHGVLGSSIKRHLNGNALYAVGSDGFQEFLEKGYLSWLQMQITQREADLAFDTAWDRFLESADPERANTAEWRVAQHVVSRFVTCDEIVNIAGDPEIRGHIAFSRETLRRAFPAACLVHGPVAAADRNLDVTTLSEALSRMALDNAIGHAAQGLIIEEWLAAPGLSRRGAASWTFGTPGPETTGGILLSVPNGLLAEGARLVAHVAVRADRRTMLRFSLCPGTQTWGASSRDIFLTPSTTKRFRIELTLAEAARYVSFRVSSAPSDMTSPLAIDFDELRFERLGPGGQHEGGLSLGLASLEAANYGALSVIGSTPVQPEGAATAPVPVEEAAPADIATREWVPRVRLSGQDDADLCDLTITDGAGSRTLARIKIDDGKVARLIACGSDGGAEIELTVPRHAHDLLDCARPALSPAHHKTIEALAIYWQQIVARVAGEHSDEQETMSPDAAVAVKADPAGVIAAIDPLWHQPNGLRNVHQILSAALGTKSSGLIPFFGVFKSLQRMITAEDHEAAWRVALAWIEGGRIALPRGTAVAVAAMIDDAGRLQAFANHLFSVAEYEATAEICRMSIERGGAPRDAYLVLARSEAAQGRSDAAGVALRLGVDRYPSDAALIMELVKWHGARGQADQAADAALQLAATEPEDPDVVAEVAARLVMAGHHDQVIAFGESYLSDEPDLRLVLSMLVVSGRAGRHDQTLRFARLAATLGAPDVQIAGPVIFAAAQLWNVGGAAAFAEEVLTRADPALLSSLLDARLRVLEHQRTDECVDPAHCADLMDWIDSRWGVFADDLKVRGLQLAAGCGLHGALSRGLMHWAVRLAPYNASAIARALLERVHNTNLPASDAELALLLVTDMPNEADRTCRVLLAAEMNPKSSAFILAAQLVGLQVGDEELVRRYGLLQTTSTFDRPLPLWPLRSDAGHWPAEPMPSPPPDKALEKVRRMAYPRCDVSWPPMAVVLPSLNQKHTIEDSLLSILNQAYPALDVIVVDGGSSDGTLDILAHYADRVQTIVRPGLSQSDALSTGFAQTSASLLGWLNTDDVLLPGALIAVASLWLTSQADVIVGDCLHFRGNDIVDVVVADRKQPPLDLEHLLSVETNWLKGRYFTQPEVFFTKAAYQNAGGYVDSDLNYAMDYDLWLRMAGFGATSVTLPRALAAFRLHPAQKTARQFDAFRELVMVRNRHRPSVPAHAQKDSPLTGPLGLCPWDALAGSPLAALIAEGAPIRLGEANDEAQDALILPPSRAHEYDGPVLDILGLGCRLPHEGEIAEALHRRQGPATAWIWTPEAGFTEKLRLSRLFDRVIPSDAVSGDYLHNLDPHMRELRECALLNPLRQTSAFRQQGGGGAAGWLHLQLEPIDAFARYLPLGAQAMTTAELYAISQGKPDSARDLLAAYDVISMTTLGATVPGIAYDAAALSCRTLVVCAAELSSVWITTDEGICLTSLPRSERGAAEIIQRVKGLVPSRSEITDNDLANRALSFRRFYDDLLARWQVDQA